MNNRIKLNFLLVGRKVEILLIFLFIVSLLGIGCKGEAEPPTIEKPIAVVQTAPVDKETAEVQNSENKEDLDAVGKFESEADDDDSKNVPPEVVSLKLVPAVIYPGTKVSVLADGRDQEEEDVTFYYSWQKNGEFLQSEDDDELDTSGFVKGDLITAFVIPFDGEKEGKQVMSPSLLVSNRPPEITSAPIGNILNGVFVYDVEAVDPDGDELKFSLEGSPPGMTIDSEGKIEWKIPTDAKGSFAVKVVVSDGDAITFQGFNIGEVVIERR